MWPSLLQLYNLKMLWMFIFIVFCVTLFLMVMFNSRKEELKKRILPECTYAEPVHVFEKKENVDEKLQILTEKLSEKERMLKLSQSEIRNAEKVLYDMESKTSIYRNRYKSLMVDLKNDVQKTEEEVKMLQGYISSLSIRREELKNEVLKQQEDYQKMIKHFNKQLENRDTMFSSNLGRSKFLIRHSTFGIRSKIV